MRMRYYLERSLSRLLYDLLGGETHPGGTLYTYLNPFVFRRSRYITVKHKHRFLHTMETRERGSAFFFQRSSHSLSISICVRSQLNTFLLFFINFPPRCFNTSTSPSCVSQARLRPRSQPEAGCGYLSGRPSQFPVYIGTDSMQADAVR